MTAQIIPFPTDRLLQRHGRTEKEQAIDAFVRVIHERSPGQSLGAIRRAVLQSLDAVEAKQQN